MLCKGAEEVGRHFFSVTDTVTGREASAAVAEGPSGQGQEEGDAPPAEEHDAESAEACPASEEGAGEDGTAGGAGTAGQDRQTEGGRGVCVCVLVYVCVRLYIRMCVHVCVRMYVYVCACV